jgi:hypothetical protein
MEVCRGYVGAGILWGDCDVTYFYLAFYVLVVVGLWQVFVKAGHPGWAAIIPFYNIYVILKIVGRPGWWLILYFIPIVNVIAWIIVSIDLAKSFGKSTGFAVGLIFLPFIFLIILGFGSDRYLEPYAAGPRAV